MDKQTPLYDVHQALQAKMCSFAGYSMPIQYPLGIMKEHEWVRSHAGLFDVSHMGQAILRGEGVAEFLTKLTPSSFLKTPISRAKYTVLTNETGGIIDDLIITRIADDAFFLVINAACKDKDLAWIKQHLPENISLEVLDSRALIAIQGQQAETVLSALVETGDLTNQAYMTLQPCTLTSGDDVFISRLGYTGEDGFEISIEGDKAAAFWESLMAHDDVEAIGLGARDSLRLEMGYPLYGNDLDDTTSPVEAGLSWIIGKENKTFIGAERVLKELEEGPSRKRVGIKLTDKGVAREGTAILTNSGETIGSLCSGGFSPTVKASIGQAYLASDQANEGQSVILDIRGRQLAAEIHAMPFIAPKTKSMKMKQAS